MRTCDDIAGVVVVYRADEFIYGIYLTGVCVGFVLREINVWTAVHAVADPSE